MKWQDLRRSGNVEDRRGRGPRMGGPAGIGIGGLILALVGTLLFGGNPLDILAQLQGGQTAPPAQTGTPPANDRQSQFVQAVLGDMEDTWDGLFQSGYQAPKLVLFDGAVDSACGFANAAVGPFYCPRDASVYLDTSFFDDLSRRFGADSDFARAYVIAHEVGHHVQNLLGVSDKVQAQRSRSDQATANQLSVRLELQADCFAGVWGHYANKRGLLEFGDVEGAIAAATAIGDDRIQKRSQGYVVPEAFTHGSAEQRVRWFRTGLETGDPAKCNTFAVQRL